MVPLTIAYAALLAVVTLLADTGGMRQWLLQLHMLPCGDKLLHFTLVGTLALLVNLSLRSIWSHAPRMSLVVGTLLVTLAATLEEGSNILVPARNWSPADLAANYLGILCVGVAPLVVGHWRRWKTHRSAISLDRGTLFPPVTW